jgi:hypothetical protein
MYPTMNILNSFPESLKVALSKRDCYLVLDLASQIGEARNELVLARIFPRALRSRPTDGVVDGYKLWLSISLDTTLRNVLLTFESKPSGIDLNVYL